MNVTRSFALAVLGLSLTAAALVGAAARPQNEPAAASARKFTIRRTPERLARGKYLVNYVADCFG